MSEGLVYFIQVGDVGPIKIGFTAGSPAVRLAALQTGNPQQLRLLAVIDGSKQLEKSLHERFGHLRLIGEWFEPGDDLLMLIEGAAMAGAASPAALAREGREPMLGLSSIEFQRLVEEVAEEIVSRRGMAEAELLIADSLLDGDDPSVGDPAAQAAHIRDVVDDMEDRDDLRKDFH